MGSGGATSAQRSLFEDYEGFVEKFKPKKTTDDCYTPPEIYDAVADWVTETYGWPRGSMLRPFYPGGDFEAAEYPDGRCVVDNPPFSILSKIKRFYLANGVPFFLFAPALTLFSGVNTFPKLTHIVCDAKVTYENGAVVPTSFVTNMGDGSVAAMSCPELSRRINEVNDRLVKAKTKQLPKYEYPDHLLTAAKMQWMARHGTELTVLHRDCLRVGKIDANPKGVFGGALLLSDRAAAERAAAEKAAAERAAAHRWELSDREREIVSRLGK